MMGSLIRMNLRAGQIWAITTYKLKEIVPSTPFSQTYLKALANLVGVFEQEMPISIIPFGLKLLGFSILTSLSH